MLGFSFASDKQAYCSSSFTPLQSSSPSSSSPSSYNTNTSTTTACDDAILRVYYTSVVTLLQPLSPIPWIISGVVWAGMVLLFALFAVSVAARSWRKSSHNSVFFFTDHGSSSSSSSSSKSNSGNGFMGSIKSDRNVSEKYSDGMINTNGGHPRSSRLAHWHMYRGGDATGSYRPEFTGGGGQGFTGTIARQGTVSRKMHSSVIEDGFELTQVSGGHAGGNGGGGGGGGDDGYNKTERREISSHHCSSTPDMDHGTWGMPEKQWMKVVESYQAQQADELTLVLGEFVFVQMSYDDGKFYWGGFLFLFFVYICFFILPRLGCCKSEIFWIYRSMSSQLLGSTGWCVANEHKRNSFIFLVHILKYIN